MVRLSKRERVFVVTALGEMLWLHNGGLKALGLFSFSDPVQVGLA